MVLRSWLEKVSGVDALFPEGVKKICILVTAALIVLFGDNVGMSPDQVERIFYLALVGVGAQGFADFGKARAAIAAKKDLTVFLEERKKTP